ncbi:MAG: nucleotidyltransferase domain-containing protein [Nanoarchaeota archaeon]|nr:nucleotidyltransferase domain-containing protein [Nanoarchaeota archaeon]
MGSPSKEEQILELILGNSPLKHWHFEEIVKETNMTRAAINKWLKKYQKEELIKRIKEKGKFPYFTCGTDNPAYKAKKKLYILNKLYQSGLISNIISLKKIKTAIIFGSIARGDWYKSSDIDIFIYGKSKGIDKHKYETKLHRNIELHTFQSKEEIKKVKTGLIKNVINGYIIKGTIQDFMKVS